MNVYLFTLCLIGLVMFFVYKMAHIGVSRSDAAYNPDETELIQEIHRGLTKMEERIDSLETILTERAERENPPKFREYIQRQAR